MRRRSLHPVLLLVLLTGIALALSPSFPGLAQEVSVFRTALTAEPPTLDPALATDLTSLEVINELFDGLVQFNEKAAPVPGLAKSWDVSNGGRTYTFHLRDARFHNGRPVTAEDFAYSWNRALDPQTKSPTAELYLGDIVGAKDVLEGKARTASGIQVIDPHTLQVTLDKPRAYFIAMLTYPVTFVVPKEAVEKGGTRWTETDLIGTGPFKLKEWVHNYKVVLEANKNYYQGAPKVDRIEMPIVSDENTRIAMYERGELDYTDVPAKFVPAMKKKYPQEVYSVPNANVYYIGFGQKAAPVLRNKLVRQALNLAVNRQILCDVILQGSATPAVGVLPPGMPAYDKNLKGLGFDPKLAKEKLAQAGYADPRKFPQLTLSYRSGVQTSQQVAEFVQAQLSQNLGISVVLQPLEWGKLLQGENDRALQMWFISWWADYMDPQNFLSILLQPGNDFDYNNPEVTRLTSDADVEANYAKRMQLYRKANEVAALDPPFLFLYHLNSTYARKPYVHGLVETPMGHLPYFRVSIKK
ncbi:MAG: peptide ABC transporter substrate-binding protein [Firmicutes bacterium]|nr:peptide ABC transporter substrate-binding protein [Bacillota bacterium]